MGSSMLDLPSGAGSASELDGSDLSNFFNFVISISCCCPLRISELKSGGFGLYCALSKVAKSNAENPSD